MKLLTARQASHLARVVRFFEERSRFPTHVELCAMTGLRSVASAANVLLALGKKGYLQYTQGGRTGTWTIRRLPDGTPVAARLVPIGPRPAGALRFAPESERVAS